MTTKSCKEYQIYDIVTKRCIKIDSHIFKTRIELQKKGTEIRFNIDDLTKKGIVLKIKKKLSFVLIMTMPVYNLETN